MTGPIKVTLKYNNLLKAGAFLSKLDITTGGKWRPSDCIPRSRIAVIVPYRDREEALSILLTNLHPFLQRQQLEYTIYVIEQVKSKLLYVKITGQNQVLVAILSF